MKFKSTIEKIRKQTNHIQLVVVTKQQSIQTVKKIYEYGERDFGENKVQDLIYKKNNLPNDIRWHMIGHLQSKKVKIIAPFIHLIQSVDSTKLLHLINKYAAHNNRTIDCLIQVKISEDEKKFGFSLKETKALFNSKFRHIYPNIAIKGIMCIGTLTSSPNKTKQEFQIMKKLYDELPIENPILSMGMSNDYTLAYHAGSNMIRIGSIIFQ